MPSFVYDLSSLEMVTLLTVVLVGSAWFGTIFLRPFARAFIRREAGAGEMRGGVVGSESPSTVQPPVARWNNC